MAWKGLANDLSQELKTRNEEIACLRRQLAERDGELAAVVNGAGNNSIPKVSPDLSDLLNKLQEAIKEKDKHAIEAAHADELFQNNLKKSDKVERDSQAEISTLQKRLAGQVEQLRSLQARDASDLASSDQDRDLLEQIALLKSEADTVKAENERLKKRCESVLKQLDVEKKENLQRLKFMRSDPSKRYDDEDDDEPLPTKGMPSQTSTGMSGHDMPLSMRLKSSTSSFETFKTAPIVPEYLLNPRSTPSSEPESKTSMIPNSEGLKPKKTPALIIPKSDKKKQRSKQEELDDEVAELGRFCIETPPAQRKRRRTVIVEEDSEEEDCEDLPDTSSFFRKRSKVSNTDDIVASPSEEDFSFAAIISYHNNGSVDDFWDSEKDAKELNACEFLWERIHLTEEIWEKKLGFGWRFVIRSSGYKPGRHSCVTRKLAGKKTNWKPDFEGTHACNDCVKNGRPCFVLWKEEKSKDRQWSYEEFRLLPLHKDAQQKAVVQGQTEVRYWINDVIDFSDKDVVNAREEDKDYID